MTLRRIPIQRSLFASGDTLLRFPQHGLMPRGRVQLGILVAEVIPQRFHESQFLDPW